MSEVMKRAGSFARDGGDNGEAEIDKLARLLLERLDLTSFWESISRENQIAPTPAACLMLLVPIYEVQLLWSKENSRSRDRWQQVQKAGIGSSLDLLGDNRGQVQQSIKQLIASAASSPAAADSQGPTMLSAFEPSTRTALSMIKAFWANFCNIPPFCGETDS